MSVNSNRTVVERQIARNINLLKQEQKKLRIKYIDLDVKIINLKAKMSELFELRKSYPTQRQKRGDGYAC